MEEARKNIEDWVQSLLRESSPVLPSPARTVEDEGPSATMNNMADPASGVPALLVSCIHLNGASELVGV